MPENYGQLFLSGMAQGQALRAGYDQMQGRQAVKKFFEHLRMLGGDDQPNAAIPVPNGGGSESIDGMAAATNAIPMDGSVAQPAKPKKVKSLTSKDIEDLDTLAAQAAAVSGDPQVYQALKGTALSYMQSKVLSGFQAAQAALQAGDEKALEDALHRVYYFVPNGESIDLKRDSSGKLQFRNPVTDKFEPVTAEILALYARGAMDPAAFGDMIYQRKKDAADAQRAERGIAVQERYAAIGEANAQETSRHNKIEEARQAGNDKVDALLKRSQAIQNLAYADYLNRGGKEKGATGLKMDDARQYAKDIRTLTQQFIMPTELKESTDEFGATKYVQAPAARPPGFENANEETVNTVSSYAEQLGIANPQLGMSSAVGAAANIFRTLQNGGNISVDTQNGLIGVPIGGKMQVFRAPPDLIALLKQQAAPPAQGIPAR